MTPSELAKVREALECATFELQAPAECVTSIRIREALAILDRKAGRKTRNFWRVDVLVGNEWRIAVKMSTRERAENMALGYEGPTRILEVTESWEEPTT